MTVPAPLSPGARAPSTQCPALRWVHSAWPAGWGGQWFLLSLVWSVLCCVRSPRHTRLT